MSSEGSPMSGRASEERRLEIGRSIVDIADATSAALCGGKATGLSRLLRAGFAVPAAICLTTDVYRGWLQTSGVGPALAALVAEAQTARGTSRAHLLATMRRRAATATLPVDLAVALTSAVARLGAGEGAVAVRSSAPYEDDADASHAGIHASFIVPGQDAAALGDAVRRCWASLWTEAAWTYRERRGIPHAEAAMAVVVQRFVPAERSGVAFSVDPLTSDRATVVIDAGWGTGAALVAGKLTPDEYGMTMDGEAPRVHRRRGRQDEMTLWRDGGEVTIPVPESRHHRPVLGEAEVVELARLTKAVERALGVPIDVEWASDRTTFWAVQARPITTLDHPGPATRWTRANLKEIFPELPSPLALSYLAAAMNRMFAAYHSAHGYLVPPGTAVVSAFRGRPYLNLSLMERMTIARGGDPAVVGRLFGGAEATQRPAAAPDRPALGSMRARVRLAREMLATFFRTPARGRRLPQDPPPGRHAARASPRAPRRPGAHRPRRALPGAAAARAHGASAQRGGLRTVARLHGARAPAGGVGPRRFAGAREAAHDRARHAAQRAHDVPPHGPGRARRQRAPGARVLHGRARR